MKTRNSKSKDKARYYPPEMMQYLFCGVCLEVVLENSEKARALYDEIIECHDLPGCREVMDKIEEIVPKGELLLKRIVKESGFDYKKPPERKNVGIPYMRGLLKGGASLASKYKNEILPWALKRKGISRDFIKLIGRINELIKVGFNNESEQSKGKYKITAFSTNSLTFVIVLRSLAEYCRLTLAEWERVKVMKISGRVYDMADIVNDEITARMHRDLVKNYKSSGFALKHDQKLKSIAERWYQCRVVNTGPEEYCRLMLINKGITLYPANISNEIKECDEAVGYPRAGRKKVSELKPDIKISKFISLYMMIQYIIESIKKKFKKR
jgi:hypothetical protein